MEKEEGGERIYVEPEYQKLCFKEGLVSLLLQILKHDLDVRLIKNEFFSLYWIYIYIYILWIYTDPAVAVSRGLFAPANFLSM